MNIFKRFFKNQEKEKEEINSQEINLSIEDSFAHFFIKKGGKFLYSTSLEEVKENISKIIQENSYFEITCLNNDLNSLIKTINIQSITTFQKETPFFTTCEHLIAENGNLLFSSNQLQEHKLNCISDHLIVYATTSQIVKNMREGLSGIKNNYEGNIPSNICAIKNYTLQKEPTNFLTSPNSNSKNLYLLLFEDL